MLLQLLTAVTDWEQDEKCFFLLPYKFLSGLSLAELDRMPVGKRSQEMPFADSAPEHITECRSKGIEA